MLDLKYITFAGVYENIGTDHENGKYAISYSIYDGIE